MSEVRDKATAVLFGSGVTTMLATVALQAMGATATAATVLGGPAVLAGLSTLWQGVIASRMANKLDKHESGKLAERNDLVRLSMGRALRAALVEKESELERNGEVSEPLRRFFKIWLNGLDIALKPDSNPAIVKGLFPLSLSEEQWTVVMRYQVDEKRLERLSREARKRYFEAQETDAEALAELLCDQLTFPVPESPSKVERFRNLLSVSPEISTIASKPAEQWDRAEALRFARGLLPIYRAEFAREFASGGPTTEAIGLKGLTLSHAKLDEIQAMVAEVRSGVVQVSGDVARGFREVTDRLDAIAAADLEGRMRQKHTQPAPPVEIHDVGGLLREFASRKTDTSRLVQLPEPTLRILQRAVLEDPENEGGRLRDGLRELFPDLLTDRRVMVANALQKLLAEIAPRTQQSCVRLNELRRMLQWFASGASKPELTIMLDLWPGYFPFFAAEEELTKNGIFIEMMQSSAAKLDVLLNPRGNVEVIGTTPACVAMLPIAELRQCRIVAVLNRSNGADKILVDANRIQLEDGKIADPSQLRGCRAVATDHSTSYFFLLKFLIDSGVDPADVNITTTKDYQTNLAVKPEISIISTWEPHASDALTRRRSLEVATHSGMGEGIVYDLLVMKREGSDYYQDSMKLLLRQHDRAVTTKLAFTPEVRKRFRQDYHLAEESYTKSLEQVQFWVGEQHFPADGEDSVLSMFERIGRILCSHPHLVPGSWMLQGWEREIKEAWQPFKMP